MFVLRSDESKENFLLLFWALPEVVEGELK